MRAEETDPVGHDDDAEGEEDGDHLTASANDAAGSASKKKKKNKKKKKKNDSGGSDSANGHDAASSKPKVDKGEADKRFNAALEAARKGELWVDLCSSSVQHVKTKKLFEALKSNDSVTSINLSDNQINDDGAQAIAAILGVNGAPALIELDLRDNPLTETGLKVLDGLMKIRKKLQVRTGSSHDPEPDPAPKPSKEIKELTKGKMFKKFFQTGDDDDDASLLQQESHLDDRGVKPRELWEGIQDLNQAGMLGPLLIRLQQLVLLLARETQSIQSKHSNAMDGSKPHIKECVANLAVLRACLDIVPRKVTVQYSREAQPAVGNHRVLVAEVVALLLTPNNISLDKAVAAAKLAPVVLHLAVSHPLCSSLHAKTMRLFNSCLSSEVPELAMQMMEPGWSCGLQDPLPGPGQTCRPLPELLAAAVTPVVTVPSGMRSPMVGFVLELAKALRETGDPSSSAHHDAVAGMLEASSSWVEFTGFSGFSDERGALQQLLEEQTGDLCGPRPLRPAAVEGSDLAELAGGGLMSGREILALLQGMSAMGVMS